MTVHCRRTSDVFLEYRAGFLSTNFLLGSCCARFHGIFRAKIYICCISTQRIHGVLYLFDICILSRLPSFGGVVHCVCSTWWLRVFGVASWVTHRHARSSRRLLAPWALRISERLFFADPRCLPWSRFPFCTRRNHVAFQSRRVCPPKPWKFVCNSLAFNISHAFLFYIRISIDFLFCLEHHAIIQSV